VEADDQTQDRHAGQRFAANLRVARERAGLSQEAVAAQMRDLGYPVRQQTIAKIEAASRTVSLDEALALARITGTTIHALIRPTGLAREAALLLGRARKVREAYKAIADCAQLLVVSRQDLRDLIERVLQAGLEEALADELFVARQAARTTMLDMLRMFAREQVDSASQAPGARLTSEERAAALELSEALRSLAEGDRPVTSLQEFAFIQASEAAIAARRAEAGLESGEGS
jgi:transcriptional regulator with XRE-family HTH domain